MVVGDSEYIMIARKVGCLTADGNVDVDLHRAPKHN